MCVGPDFHRENPAFLLPLALKRGTSQVRGPVRSPAQAFIRQAYQAIKSILIGYIKYNSCPGIMTIFICKI